MIPTLFSLSGVIVMRLKKKYIINDENDDDISIYSKDGRESMLEDDELSPMEEAFMSGYEDAA